MTETRPPIIRLGLQAKILIAVMSLVVVVASAMLWAVDRSMQRQMDETALQTLSNAQLLITQSLENRLANITEHYRSIAREARFTINARLGDGPTMRDLLKSLVSSAPDAPDIFLFFDAKRTLLADASRAGMNLDPQAFARAIGPSGPAGLRGGQTTIGFDGGAYDVVTVPVTEADGGETLGVLAIGVRITDEFLKTLQPLGAETFLVVEGQPAVSTRRGLPDAASLKEIVASPSNPRAILLGSDHFLAVSSPLHAYDPKGLRYVTLWNYQPGWVTLTDTRRTLIEISGMGMLLGGFVISWVVRRLTRPLQDLRDGAEAVGRGDFSRRIERLSQDECGDLADAFNRMTASLQGSRAELEKTVDTLESTQAQLIQSEKLSAVGQFVAGVAHELNNPLTSVIGFSELLSSTTADPKQRKHLDQITTSAQRCHKIVQSLLSFARQDPPQRVMIHVNDTIDEVLELMAYDLRTNNVTIERDFQADLPVIEADPHQLQQVFVNILSNARQAIEPFRPDGRIVVRTRTRGPFVRLEFIDNGPGIRPENLTRVFDPFFTTKPVGKGTGLGMSLCYGIVHEHNGEIAVESVFGAGATFRIELPVALAGGMTRAAVPLFRPATRHPFPAGKVVLVIDDEEPILQLGRVVLESEGYRVDTASGGEEAIRMIAQQKYDVVVCDWKMPGLSGIHLYDYLCAHDVVAASRMVFMTGDVVSDTFQAFLKQNSKRCLSKPFRIEDFRSVVNATVSAANE